MTKEQVVEALGLLPHPEGGYFKETYHSDFSFNREQTLYSSILFLLGKEEVSHLHVLEEDELWYFQGGEDLDVYEIDSKGNVTITTLGLGKGKTLQHLVKKGQIFGSISRGDNYTLVGCMVSPSFTYNHFKLVSKKELPPMKEDDFKKIEKLLSKED